MFSTSKTFPVEAFLEQVDALITELFELEYGIIATLVAISSFFDENFDSARKPRALY